MSKCWIIARKDSYRNNNSSNSVERNSVIMGFNQETSTFRCTEWKKLAEIWWKSGKNIFYTEMPERGKRLILTPVLNICMKPLFVDHPWFTALQKSLNSNSADKWREVMNWFVGNRIVGHKQNRLRPTAQKSMKVSNYLTTEPACHTCSHWALSNPQVG